MQGQFFNLKERTKFYLVMDTFYIVPVGVGLALGGLEDAIALWLQDEINWHAVLLRTVVLLAVQGHQFVLVQVYRSVMFGLSRTQILIEVDSAHTQAYLDNVVGVDRPELVLFLVELCEK